MRASLRLWRGLPAHRPNSSTQLIASILQESELIATKQVCAWDLWLKHSCSPCGLATDFATWRGLKRTQCVHSEGPHIFSCAKPLSVALRTSGEDSRRASVPLKFWPHDDGEVRFNRRGALCPYLIRRNTDRLVVG